MATTAANTYDVVNPIREDLADVIYDVSPTETPFVSMCEKVSCDNTLFEWQTDTLADVSATVAAEGDAAEFTVPDDTIRLNNYTEIITKTASVTGTQEAVNQAGKESEMRYQIVRRGRELRRDMEHHLVGLHNAKVAGSNAATPVPRETASYATWIKTNGSFGTGGSLAAGTGANIPTAGTARPFTEDLLGAVIDSCWQEGGEPSIIMCGSAQKRVLNSFAGNTKDGSGAGNITHDNTDKKIINAVSVYVSDYFELKVVPNRWVKATDVLVIQPEYWKIAQLRPIQQHQIAKVGDAERRQILVEYGLRANNEASSGIILGLS